MNEDNIFFWIVGLALFSLIPLGIFMTKASDDQRKLLRKNMDDEAPDHGNVYFTSGDRELFSVQHSRRRLVLVNRHGLYKSIPYEHIAGVDVCVNGGSIMSTSVSDIVSRSLVGGVVGALTAKRVVTRMVSDIHVDIRTNQLSEPTIRINMLDVEVENYPEITRPATDIANIVRMIVEENAAEETRKRSEEEASKQTPASAPQPVSASSVPSATPSVADELRKLADLHTQGILTDAEFQDQKQRLLSGK